jgi:hypothetical protein
MKRIYFGLIIFFVLHAWNCEAQVVLTKNDTIDLCYDSLVLRVNDFRGEVQWQFCPDSIHWTDLSNETKSSLFVKPNNYGLFRAKISERNCSPLYSDTVSVQPKVCINGKLPVVQTNLIKSITNNSVQFEGTVINDGGLEILSRGIVWHTSIDPTIESNLGFLENGNGLGVFSGGTNNLIKNTTYYIRTYATNKLGTSYGEELIFTTFENMDGCSDKLECCNLKYSHLAIESLNLNDLNYRKIHDFLYQVDRTNAYHVFTRDPEDFLMWCEMIDATDVLDKSTISAALHETNHMIISQLRRCNSTSFYSFLFMGMIYSTELNKENTAHISVVEETILDIFKNPNFYKTYIEDSKPYNNNFAVLLNELNSYTGGGWFDFQYLNSGLLPDISWTSASEGQLSGMINFMAFLQYYLKSVRLNHSATYQTIKSQKTTLNYIQTLWSKAEEVLVLSYPITKMSGTNSKYQILFNEDYFDIIYSDDLLQELDSIGIIHKERAFWKDTFLK